MAPEHALAIEVVYALPDVQEVVALEVAPGTTIEQAIALSGLPSRYPGVDFTTGPVGVYGQLVSRDTYVAAGDRVEIYRPLIADPKQARRRRAARP